MQSEPIQAAEQPAGRQLVESERESLRQQLADWLEPVLVLLGLATLVLLLVQLTVNLSQGQTDWINHAQLAIWSFFAVEFAAELALACDRRTYLRDNWLTAIAVLLPFLRVLGVVRALLVLRHLNLLWLLMRTNRLLRSLRSLVPGRELTYLVLLTGIVVAVGTAGAYYFEQGQSSSGIKTLGDALWWAASLVTTINSGLDPVSFEGRLLAILLRAYAVGVFGLIAGNVASWVLQRRGEGATSASP
jgi:voltage-gated potassium channel